MLKIILVEDDASKADRVSECLREAAASERSEVDISRASDARSAKQLLKDNQYDLMVLDIALPERRDEDVKPLGGIDLLDEILRRDIYRKPQHIVGLTAFDEVLDDAGRRFADDLWLVVKYDARSEDWIERLTRKVHHLLVASRSAEATLDYASDLCVLAALPEPELSGVLRLPWNWRDLQIENDSTIYHRGEFERDGSRRSVYAACCSRMGMTAAAILSMKMISVFRPRYIGVVGLLAGIKGECELGDIIAADPSWDWGSGKQHVRDGAPVFLPAPHQTSLNSSIRSKLVWMMEHREVLDEVRRDWQGEEPPTPLKMHLGPVASGAAVLADPRYAELIKTQHRKLIGIDMETYAVLAAAEECSLPQPKAFSIKSVSDFADPSKGDSHRNYAAYTSAAALKIFVERYL